MYTWRCCFVCCISLFHFILFYFARSFFFALPNSFRSNVILLCLFLSTLYVCVSVCMFTCLRFTLFRLNCCLSHFQREPHLNNHWGNRRWTATIFDGIFILKFFPSIRSTFHFTVCTTFLCNILNSFSNTGSAQELKERKRDG